jgi:NTE family protein
MPRPVGFVFGGGASFGAVQGMLQALAEVELRPDLVVGTSVGSANGAVLAEDPSGAANRLSHL